MIDSVILAMNQKTTSVVAVYPYRRKIEADRETPTKGTFP